jgi:hypothetical protein
MPPAMPCPGYALLTVHLISLGGWYDVISISDQLQTYALALLDLDHHGEVGAS